jgi:hypothetical protein
MFGSVGTENSQNRTTPTLLNHATQVVNSRHSNFDEAMELLECLQPELDAPTSHHQ